MKKLLPLIAALALLLVSGCADSISFKGETRPGSSAPAGFWRGWWHGCCSPFAFVGIMFGADVGIYEPYNNGNWYNFGFLIGSGVLLKGASVSYRSKKP